jgi:uncharacterized protein
LSIGNSGWTGSAGCSADHAGPADVTVLGVTEQTFASGDGIRITPDRPSGVGVLTIAGSSGRIEADRARLLAANGAVVESIRWFGGPGQQPAPYEVPLEIFIARVDALSVDCDRIVLMGSSFGAEAVLLTATLDDRVDGVVAFAPSDVVWAGFTETGQQRSHWTFSGESLCFVPLLDDWRPSGDPPAFRELYRMSRQAAPDRVAAARIPVQRIGELLVVAGGDDQVWDAVDHARRIVAARTDHGLSSTLVEHPGAGHRTVLPGEPVVATGRPMARGGTPDHDRQLGDLAWPQILQMIRSRA